MFEGLEWFAYPGASPEALAALEQAAPVPLPRGLLDLRDGAPYPVVAIDLCNGDLADTVLPVAASFDAFLGLVGWEGDSEAP